MVSKFKVQSVVKRMYTKLKFCFSRGGLVVVELFLARVVVYGTRGCQLPARARTNCARARTNCARARTNCAGKGRG